MIYSRTADVLCIYGVYASRLLSQTNVELDDRVYLTLSFTPPMYMNMSLMSRLPFKSWS